VPRLSDLPTRKVIKAFERAGWVLRQGGKHMVLTKAGVKARLVIPRHRTVKQGLLVRQIKNAGLTIEAFLELYEG
jgi:predicted RNA binding protein YcfA (HicA-like mRNA interferase family)